MTIASTRAQAVATILWELKRAEKLSTLSAIADRAGFSPGPSGRTISTCLKTVRRDWPHLEWWRAVADNGQLEQEQASFLKTSRLRHQHRSRRHRRRSRRSAKS